MVTVVVDKLCAGDVDADTRAVLGAVEDEEREVDARGLQVRRGAVALGRARARAVQAHARPRRAVLAHEAAARAERRELRLRRVARQPAHVHRAPARHRRARRPRRRPRRPLALLPAPAVPLARRLLGQCWC